MEEIEGRTSGHRHQKLGEFDATDHHLVKSAKKRRVGQKTILHAIVQELIVLLQHLVDIRHFLLVWKRERLLSILYRFLEIYRSSENYDSNAVFQCMTSVCLSANS